MESSELKKQWHAPFCSAVRLELVENKGDMDFKNEYNLSSKPLQIDLLVIKKTEDVLVNNEIGKIFRGHNLMEYKSPGDKLNIDTFYKVLGYACFYKANGGSVDAIKEDDITLSFVREEYPRKLLTYFKEHGFTVKEAYSGIYYVVKDGFFPIQVIVSSELDEEAHIWLASLTRNIKASTAETLVYKISGMAEKEDLLNASAVLDLTMHANPKVFRKVKEEYPMFEELQKLMKPHTDKLVEEAVKENTSEVRAEAVDTVMSNFHITLEEACGMFGMTVEEYKQAKADWEKRKQAKEMTGANA